jgi:Ricin-type beta-trefoil lectin domain
LEDIKLSPITETYPNSGVFQGSMASIDGVAINGSSYFKTNLYSNGSYSPLYTSQNIPPNNVVLPPQAAWNWAMDNRCDGANVQQVVMRPRNNGQCQAMAYNSSNNTIINAYSKCLDAGNVNDSNNNWLRFSPCHYGNNQKWRQEPINQGGRIWSYERNSANQVMCIQYQSLTDQYGLNVVPCSSSQNQKWFGDVGITVENVPAAGSSYKAIKSYTNSGLGFNIYGNYTADETKIQLFNLSNPAANNELFQMQSDGQIRSINGKCVDAWDVYNPNNRWLRILSCNGGTNQKFTLDGQARLHSVTAPSLCVESKLGNVSESTLYMNTCNNNTNQQWNLN